MFYAARFLVTLSDTDPLKQVETDSNKHLAERDRRRIRRERRSTGVVKLEEVSSGFQLSLQGTSCHDGESELSCVHTEHGSRIRGRSVSMLSQ